MANPNRTGKVIGKLVSVTEETRETKSGSFTNHSLIIQTIDTFKGQESIKITKVDFFRPTGKESYVGSKGKMVSVTFDPVAREYNGKYYNDNKGQSLDVIEGKGSEMQQSTLNDSSFDNIPFDNIPF